MAYNDPPSQGVTGYWVWPGPFVVQPFMPMFVLDPRIDRILELVEEIHRSTVNIQRKEAVMALTLKDVKTAVLETVGIEQSAVTLILQLRSLLMDAQAGGDQVSLQEIIDALGTEATALGNAVTANPVPTFPASQGPPFNGPGPVTPADSDPAQANPVTGEPVILEDDTTAVNTAPGPDPGPTPGESDPGGDTGVGGDQGTGVGPNAADPAAPIT